MNAHSTASSSKLNPAASTAAGSPAISSARSRADPARGAGRAPGEAGCRLSAGSSRATSPTTSATGSGSTAPERTRVPNRGFNPLRQAHRLDPDGAYFRRYVNELGAIEGSPAYEMWKVRENVPGY